jgi:membrane-associated phospholipid phosphatase
MQPLIDWGIALIVSLQHHLAWLVLPMQLFTFLGSEQFYLFIAPALFWCVDTVLGFRLSLWLMTSGLLNLTLKILFHGPRPYWYSPLVKAYSTESTFGLPSGHAQNAMVIWGALASWLRKNWAWAAAAAMIFLIGISRITLGVHFPHDVVLGWLIGALLFWAFLAFEPIIAAYLSRRSPSDQAVWAIGASLAILLLAALARLALGLWTVPPLWVTNAHQAAPAADPIDPLALSDIVSNAGAFLGLALGGILLKARGWLDAGGPAWQRLARFLVGILGVYLLWYGLGLVLPRGESLLPYLLRYLRYTLVGFWITGAAPLVFIRLRLAETLKLSSS